MKYIIIKGTKYKIYFINMVEKYNQSWDGLCDKKNKVIYIEGSLCESDRQKTILHECGHGIVHECAIDQAISQTAEEIICENFAQEMFKIFFKQPLKKTKKKSKV